MININDKNSLLDTSIDEFFSDGIEQSMESRIINSLTRYGIYTVRDLVNTNKDDISLERNLGDKVMELICKKLSDFGLSFETKIDSENGLANYKNELGRAVKLLSDSGIYTVNEAVRHSSAKLKSFYKLTDLNISNLYAVARENNISILDDEMKDITLDNKELDIMSLELVYFCNMGLLDSGVLAVLYRNDIFTLKELVMIPSKHLESIRNVGATKFQTIRKLLDALDMLFIDEYIDEMRVLTPNSVVNADLKYFNIDSIDLQNLTKNDVITLNNLLSIPFEVIKKDYRSRSVKEIYESYGNIVLQESDNDLDAVFSESTVKVLNKAGIFNVEQLRIIPKSILKEYFRRVKYLDTLEFFEEASLNDIELSSVKYERVKN